MKKILVIILLLSIIVSSPLLFTRTKTELANNTYEVIVPYDEIKTLLSFSIDVYPELLKQVQSVSLEPTLTLERLHEKGIVDIREKTDLSLIPDIEMEQMKSSSGLYITIKDDATKRIKDRILTAFGDFITREEEFDAILDGEVYFIKGFNNFEILLDNRNTMKNPILTLPLGFDLDLVHELEQIGFETVFRIGTNISSSNIFVFEDMLEINKMYGFNKILFSGNNALGLTNKDVKKAMTKLRDNGFIIMPIEFNEQKGFGAYEELFGNQVVRLHSIDPFNGRGGYAERASRAVFERNIRAVFVHIISMKEVIKPPEEIQPAFDKAMDITADIHKMIANQKFFNAKPGIAVPYEDVGPSKLLTLAAVIGIIAFFGLAGLRVSKPIAILAMAGIGAIGLLYTVTGIHLIAQALALAVTVVAATYAVVSAEKMEGKSIAVQYLLSIAIALVGAFYTVVLLFGTEYFIKFEEFRGVKLLLGFPIILVALHFLKNDIRKIAVLPVRYYHVAIIAIFCGIALIYLSRSGNNPLLGASGLEMAMRDFLEETLGIRPRTKEFLIGFPLFILAMHLVKKGYNWAVYLYIMAAVGFASMVNTFTHLHIPFYISVIRTVYGVVFGAIIGIVLIILFEIFMNKVWPSVKTLSKKGY